jgi:hypothetical protein
VGRFAEEGARVLAADINDTAYRELARGREEQGNSSTAM